MVEGSLPVIWPYKLLLQLQQKFVLGFGFGRGWGRFALLAGILLLAGGCASTARRQATDRQFVLGQDSFAYANELLWEYEPDPVTGKMETRPRDPKPEYRHQCFVMARAARQFFDFARFDPDQSTADGEAYRELIEQVIRRDPRTDPARHSPVIIPGYANLHDFSRDHEGLLKELCGGNWQSFVQRGHWRVVFPFSGRQQESMATRLTGELERGVAPVLHLIRFPAQTINHAVVLYSATPTAEGVRFQCYDPNEPTTPLVIDYREMDRRFYTPPNRYFAGGRVDVYEVYRNWLY